MIQADYQANGRRSAGRMNAALRLHILPALGDVLVERITQPAFDYLEHRIGQEHAAPATARYSTSIVRRMVQLAYMRKMIAVRPYIPSVQVHNARTGFFTNEEIGCLAEYLPPALSDAALFAWQTGWRREEVFGLTWHQVDPIAQVVRLEPGTTKTGEGRVFPYGESIVLRAVLARRWRGRWGDFIFHRRGERVRDFRTAWIRACTRAGVGHRLFHDLRRTAARDMERAGIPRTTAMKLIGLKTENMYRRYSIVAERDLNDGVKKLNAYVQSRTGSATPR